MAAEPTASYAPDQRVDEVLAEYLQAVQAGRAPDRKEFLARHPELTADLAAFFADDAAVRDMAAPFRPTPQATAGDTAVVPALPISQRFGDYEILEEFARSGMGIVYKARQISLDRIVALKMVQPGGRSLEDLERFLHTEARAVAGLDHPHIVPVYDFGVHEGRPFFSMKLMENRSLDQHLSRFRNDPRASARLVATAARAVHHAHQRGLLHRDLKPANILLDAQGQPHVTDFGLAKRVTDETTSSQVGAIVGTPAYMAPEQAAADPVLTTTVDVYGLGAILYALLTGQPPCRGTNVMDTLLLVRTQVPARPRSLNPKADRDLETICLKCLEKEQANRYGSAEALADDLERWLAGEPIRARRSGSLERMRKWVKKRPAIAAMWGAILVVSALGIAGIIWQWQEAETSQQQATEKANKAEQAQKAEADARHKETELRNEVQQALARERINLAHQSVRLAYQYWRDSKVYAADRSLDACPPELRHWEWHYLKRLFHAERLNLVHENGVFDVAYSPDGKRLATSGAGVTIWDAQTGAKITHLPGRQPEDGQTTGLAYSPGGKYLAVAGGWIGRRAIDPETVSRGFVRIYDALKDRELFTIVNFRAIVYGVAFSPDGKCVATAGGWGDNPAELKVWNAESRKELLNLRGHTSTVWQVAFSPDGKLLASTSEDGTGRLWDAATGRELFVLRGRPGAAVGLAFSPDGKWLATSLLARSEKNTRTAAQVKVWDVSTGKLLFDFRTHPSMVRRLTFSPDGKVLATCGNDRTARLWDAATGDELMTLRGHREYVDIDQGPGKGRITVSGFGIGWVVSLAFSPDGKCLATAGSDLTVRVWDITKEQECFQFSARDATILGFTGDGKEILTLDRKRLNRRDVDTGRIINSVRLPQVLWAPILSADGRRIAGRDDKGRIRVWDAATGKEVIAVDGDLAAFSPDGKYLATVIGGPKHANVEPSFVQLWDAASGEKLVGLQRHSCHISGLEFTHDGKRLASLGSITSNVNVWDMDGNQEVCHFQTEVGAGSPPFVLSPDGTQLAGIGWDNGPVIRVYDLKSGKEILVLTGHTLELRCLAYSPDGKRLASGGSDDDVKMWDLETGQEVISLPLQAVNIESLLFSPDGHRLAASGPNGITVWDATPLEKKKGQ
jgi:WD40 repeat protein